MRDITLQRNLIRVWLSRNVGTPIGRAHVCLMVMVPSTYAVVPDRNGWLGIGCKGKRPKGNRYIRRNLHSALRRHKSKKTWCYIGTPPLPEWKFQSTSSHRTKKHKHFYVLLESLFLLTNQVFFFFKNTFSRLFAKSKTYIKLVVCVGVTIQGTTRVDLKIEIPRASQMLLLCGDPMDPPENQPVIHIRPTHLSPCPVLYQKTSRIWDTIWPRVWAAGRGWEERSLHRPRPASNRTPRHW